MSACCVSGCTNQPSTTSKLKFYSIPSGSPPFQAKRRRLWLQAIQQVNGSTEELKGNACICGAHFNSQEPSMDHDSPDFVPSVFTCAKQSSKKKAKWVFGRRKRRRRRVVVATQEETIPPRVDPPVDLQSSSSVLTEEMQTPSAPSVPEEEETLTEEPETVNETATIISQTASSPNKEEETLTEEPETETATATIISQTASSPNKVLPSFKVPEDFPELDKGSPIVLLKHVYTPAGGYLCEQCNQSFTNVSQLVEHNRLHEEESCFICELCAEVFTSHAGLTEHKCVQEPSFPCNICDRSFTTSHYLKRHKLLHVKDGRKCSACGVLFCRRHNHVLFLPSAETVTEYEEDDSTTVKPQLYSNVMSEDHQLEKPKSSQTGDVDDDAQSTMAVSPLPPKHGLLSKTHEAPSPLSHTRISEILQPVFLKPPPVSRMPPPVTRILNMPGTSSQFKLPLPDYPPQHLELPPSLKLFSPQYLTSAFLEVKRNYEYILSKPRDLVKNIVKEEQCDLPIIPPDEQSIVHVKKERTAYGLDFAL